MFPIAIVKFLGAIAGNEDDRNSHLILLPSVRFALIRRYNSLHFLGRATTTQKPGFSDNLSVSSKNLAKNPVSRPPTASQKPGFSDNLALSSTN